MAQRSAVGWKSKVRSFFQSYQYINTRPQYSTQFIAPLEIVSYGDEAAHYYGDLRAHLEKQGTPIGSLDMLIAAHALSIACTLVTNNEKEFIRIPNLKIDNWAK